MNLPNKLTLLRIILVPVFVALLLLTQIPHSFLWCLIVFIIASVTDLLDGKIARRNNQITDFGKFADPLADKILVMAAFACFVQLGIMGAVPLIIVLFREFAVTSVRLVAASKGNVVSANIWGKAKTVSQIVAIVAVILLQYIIQLITVDVIPLPNGLPDIKVLVYIIDQILIWITVLLTLVSGFIYLKDNKECFKAAK